jgi:hypothetical protein
MILIEFNSAMYGVQDRSFVLRVLFGLVMTQPSRVDDNTAKSVLAMEEWCCHWVMLVTTLLSHASNGANESVLAIAHQGATTDCQGAIAGHYGATVNCQGAPADRQGVITGCQGVAVNRQGVITGRQGAAKQQHWCHRLLPWDVLIVEAIDLIVCIFMPTPR